MSIQMGISPINEKAAKEEISKGSVNLQNYCESLLDNAENWKGVAQSAIAKIRLDKRILNDFIDWFIETEYDTDSILGDSDYLIKEYLKIRNGKDY